jgi:hypothetical protein
MNIEDEHIWTLVKNVADECKRDLIDIAKKSGERSS